LWTLTAGGLLVPGCEYLGIGHVKSSMFAPTGKFATFALAAGFAVFGC